MTTTTKLGLELLANNAANQTLANLTFAQLNQIVQGGAVDRTNTPPGSPADEALYIITATATGAWAGKENQLAYWLTSTAAWTYIVPREGFLIHVNDEDLFYKYDGSAWASFSGGGMTNPMTTAGDIIIGGASGTPTRLAAGTDGYVLTLASGSPTWAPPSGGGGATLPVVQALSSTRNLVLADINTFNVNSTTNNYTVTIQPQSAETWTADAEIHFLPSSTGNIVITGGAGVSLNGVVAGSITLSTAFGAASIKRIAPDSWWVGGVLGTLAEQRTAIGLGAGDSPTFTALTLSNGQIAFPATQVPSANANTLDDYEEGTWTPVLTFATPGDLSVAYSTQSGSYTKIGDRVFFECRVITSTFTHSTASGNARITGLPFISGVTNFSALSWQGITAAGYADVTSAVISDRLEFRASASGSSILSISSTHMPTGASVQLNSNGAYRV